MGAIPLHVHLEQALATTSGPDQGSRLPTLAQLAQAAKTRWLNAAQV